ncbi:MAG: hypothetical protein Q8P61_00915 [Candidatus Nanopelagicales bacterium]|nr:hypothetical protein [Candidatus Nanopelagicales bacterium]
MSDEQQPVKPDVGMPDSSPGKPMLIPQPHGGAICAPFGSPDGPPVNAGGTAKGQAFPLRWLRAIADERYEDLEVIATDRNASASKRAAARLVLDALDESPNVRRKAWSEMCDRLCGKASQPITGADGGALATVLRISMEGTPQSDQRQVEGGG